MSDYITDPDLLEKLNAPAEKPADKAADSGYITDPALLAQLNGEEVKGPDVKAVPALPVVNPVGTNITGVISHTPLPGGMHGPTIPSMGPVTAVAPGAQSLFSPAEIKAAQNLGQSAMDLGKATVGAYRAAPWKIAADLATTSVTGVPVFGVAGTAENMAAKGQAVKDAMAEISKLASQTEPVIDAAGKKSWPAIDAYREMWKSASPEIQEKLSSMFKHGGAGPNELKSFLLSPEGQELMKNDARFAAGATKYLEEVPGFFKQAGRLVAPPLRIAGKVLGPAAFGYDLYQAGQLARETQLGERLAQGEGQFAPNAARNLTLNTNVSGYQPSPQEAANLLASGDARTIQMYGGAPRLQQIAGQRQAQPAMPSWIDNAMQNFQRYRGVIGQ